jgi:hypothetical protein
MAEALLVSEHEGAGQIEATVRLPIEMLSSSEKAPELDSLTVQDVDADGEVEIEVHLSFMTHPADPSGATERTQMFVLDIEPLARVAFTMLTSVKPVSGAGAVTSATKFEDVDGEGHPDIVVAGKQCIATACEPMEVTFFYNPASDSWAEQQ